MPAGASARPPIRSIPPEMDGLLTHLYVIGASGAGERVLVSDTRSTHVDEPAWATDSTRIAFAFAA